MERRNSSGPARCCRALAARRHAGVRRTRRPRLYGARALVDVHGDAAQGAARSSPRPTTSSTIRTSATPCFLLNLGRPVGAGSDAAPRGRHDLRVERRRRAVAQRSSSFSAICAHKLAYPTRDVSFIRYQPPRSATSDGARDPLLRRPQRLRSGRRRARRGRSRRRSRSPRSCSSTTPRRDELVALGTRRRRAIRRVLRKYEFKLALEYGGRRRSVRCGARPSCASSTNTAGRRSSADAPRADDAAIVVRDLRKRYGRVEAVNGISFAVRARHDDGAARRQRRRQDDDAVDAARRAARRPRARHRARRATCCAHRHRVLPRMNFTSPYVDLPKRLTVRENLRVFADLYGVATRATRIAEVAADRSRRSAEPALRRAVGGAAHARIARQGGAERARRCCCSTSRRRRSIRTSATGCAPISSSYQRRAAARCCSRRTTWAKSSGCATT